MELLCFGTLLTMQETNNKYWWGGNTLPKKGNMLFLGKSKSDWKAIELHYRREWICFVVGFVLGVILL